MTKPRTLPDAFARLAAAEQSFLQREFLAPVLRGGTVTVRIAGIVCTLNIMPRDFEGWGVFKPSSHAEATLTREASLGERWRYLELFPLVRLILLERREGEWHALPAHRADGRFKIEGLVPVALVEDGRTFEVIEARFDGNRFWHAGADERRDPATAKFLRDHLEKLTLPEQVTRPGLTPEERSAYALAWHVRYETSEEAKQSREERRLRHALAHAGAELKEYVERRDVYTVTYEVDGRRHVSAVNKADLSVQVAGICLDGEDAKFDLQSLVGVLREGHGRGLVHTGDWN